MGVLNPVTWDLVGEVVANAPVSAGLIRLDVRLARAVAFQPGQFAMINLTGPGQLVFRRPFSILAADDDHMSFLYRVVGRGTALLADLRPGDLIDCLAPLGRAFLEPEADTPPALVLAGGVGLPPLHAWARRYGRPDDVLCFGTRDGGDVPWSLLGDAWLVSVDRLEDVPAGREVAHGLVTELALSQIAGGSGPMLVLACGPTPLLRAAARLAADRRWPCHVSLEEHMGCGYGVCKGCVVPVLTADQPGWRHATSCLEGPVFDAATLDWSRGMGAGPEVTP